MAKQFVYSARTTEKGLALLNKTKDAAGKSWDQFINDAVIAHYKLDAKVVALPPSKFLADREANRAKKEADKAKKTADRKAAAEKKAADKKAKAAAAKKGGKKAEKHMANAANALKADSKPATEAVTVNPGETVVTTAGERVTADKANTKPMVVPTKGTAMGKAARKAAAK
jgi:colicin import membrane protein